MHSVRDKEFAFDTNFNNSGSSADLPGQINDLCFTVQIPFCLSGEYGLLLTSLLGKYHRNVVTKVVRRYLRFVNFPAYV